MSAKKTYFEVSDFDSSFINHIIYDAISQRLRIELASGNYYVYEGVPMKVFKGLVRAESKGTYFNKKIKMVYSATK